MTELTLCLSFDPSQGEFTVMLLRLTLQGLELDFSNFLFIVLASDSTNPGNDPDPGIYEV